MTDAAMAAATRRVDMWFAGTAPQRRLTVAFRIILAIPQIIVLYFLFIAAVFVLVIGWFGALFMGRLPEWVHSFVGGVVRWTTRVGAYMFLLTDRYPPFSLDDEDYPARPILPEPGRLNRWAVLFRLILVIPAYVFAQIVEYGLTFPLLFVAWLIALFSGRMHPALYPAYSALLRYQVRLHSYLFMLTSEYAWGMLGDPSAALSPFAPLPPPPSFPTPQAPGPTATGLAPSPPAPTPPAQPYAYPSASTASTAGDAPPPAGEPPEPTAPDQLGPVEPVDRACRPRSAAVATAHATATAPHRPRRDAPAVPVGALGAVGAAGGRDAGLGNPGPDRRRPRLDDLRHRVGLHRLRGPERGPEPGPVPSAHLGPAGQYRREGLQQVGHRHRERQQCILVLHDGRLSPRLAPRCRVEAHPVRQRPAHHEPAGQRQPTGTVG